MNARDIAKMIDISAVRTHSTLADIEENVRYAAEYRFINVHVLPCWISTLAGMLAPIDGVYAGAPVGFPSGAHKTETKLLEAAGMIADGVEEMDIMMNVGKFRNKEYGYVLDEAKEVVSLAKGAGRPIKTKMLIEINCLDDGEMVKAAELAVQSGADFVKTGTGWVPGGANVERIRRIRDAVGGGIEIKAAGGIRTRDELMRLLDAGVTRFGINTKSAIEIIKTFEQEARR
jgi:deoxyribose-phosphate aldolase